jgi:hypothetical protein
VADPHKPAAARDQVRGNRTQSFVCRKPAKQVLQGAVDFFYCLQLASGSVRFFRQLVHYLEELRCLPNK